MIPTPRLALAPLILLTSAAAQVQWTPTDIPVPHTGFVMATDLGRSRVVLFGGTERTTMAGGSVPGGTWEWDGARWEERSLPIEPPKLTAGSMAMATDPANTGVLLVTGTSPPGTRQAWSWNGAAWSRGVDLPTANPFLAAAADLGRNRVVVVASPDRSGAPVETWEWDGLAWSPITSATAPIARAHAAMAYDQARNEVVLFGGEEPQTGRRLQDTWTWNGRTWTQQTTPLSLFARAGMDMCYSPAHRGVILYGGYGPGVAVYPDTWLWTGSWQRIAITSPIGGRFGFGLVLDPNHGEPLLHGGTVNGHGRRSDTWHLGPAGWELSLTGRPMANSVQMVWQSGSHRLVVANGIWRADNTGSGGREVWERLGTEWREIATLPRGDLRCLMAYDTGRDRIVVHFEWSQRETWELEGPAWVVKSPYPAPTPRAEYASMAYDPVGRSTILFIQGETWSWDGSRWQRLSPPNSPSQRWKADLATDPDRGRIVLFGGEFRGSNLADTWEWDGSNWIQRTPAQSPPPSRDHAMEYDSSRRRVVLWGGWLADVWEWDGNDWTQRQTNRLPGTPSSEGFDLVFDPDRGEMTMLAEDGLWHYGPVHPAGSTSFGAGCPGSLGTPNLVASLPWLGDSLDVELDAVPTGASAFLMAGTSASRWGALSLPFDLSRLGLTGCTLFLGPEAISPMSTAANRATWSARVPNDPNLLGRSLFAQSILLGAGGANAFGAALSDALDLVFGAK